MLVPSAVALINESLIFLPGWKITAEDYTSRHEGCVALHIGAPSYETNRSEAMLGYPVENEPHAVVMIQVTPEMDLVDLFYLVLSKIIEFQTHEFREGMRVKPTGWAPFHPHKIDGIHRWCARSGEHTAEKDLSFGFNHMKFIEPAAA
jgi:hypothetical protein